MELSVYDAPELPFRETGRGKPALREFDRDHRPDLVVLVLPALQLAVPPTDELLDRFAEVGDDVRDDPDRGRRRQVRRGGQVAHEVRRELVGHAPSYRRRGASASFLPASGQGSGDYGREPPG